MLDELACCCCSKDVSLVVLHSHAATHLLSRLLGRYCSELRLLHALTIVFSQLHGLELDHLIWVMIGRTCHIEPCYSTSNTSL